MSLHGIDTSKWHFARHHIGGTISTPDEITIATIDVPASTNSKKGTLLLIHGFPQTSHQFRHVANPLAQAGYRVIIPDYRGAGESSKPVTNFDKRTMAADIRVVVFDRLDVKGKVHVVGHDIGGMIAHAFAAHYPDQTASVIWGECPLPGSTTYTEAKNTPEMWHFTFHNQYDLPELLVTGREKQYIKHFYNRLCVNHNFLTEADWNYYASMYAQPGALRAGFNCYRAFEEDAEDNIHTVKEAGKCQVPCLGLNGAGSLLGGDRARRQCEEMYTDVKMEHVSGSGHWIAEENPEGFVEKVVEFVGSVGD